MVTFQAKRRLYETLPSWSKAQIGWIPFSWLAGKHYRHVWKRTQRLERATRQELEAYQEKALGELLHYVCDQVPAYHRYRGLVERVPPRQALQDFPFLDKEKLQADLIRYLPRDFKRIPHYECTTGGTSGNQMRFFVDDHSQAIETAFMHRQWTRVGYRTSSRKATFRGVPFGDLKPGIFWRSNPVYNELQFSPYHMNQDNLGLYWERLLQYRPQYIHGYPSAVALLADYLVRQQLPGERLRLKAILLGSEGASRKQRQVIEQAFQTRVFSWYGHSERVVLGGECERSEAYHQFPDYGILEIVDKDQIPVQQEGQGGEIVGTGFLNRSLPLLRYRTGDHARCLDWRCECGRAFDRFDEVQGRWCQEFVLGKQGACISLAALNVHGACFDRVIRYQYYQCEPGKMDLRIMVDHQFEKSDEDELLQVYADKLGGALDVTVRVVDELPLTERGKLRKLIQEIPQMSSALTETFTKIS